MEKSALNEKPGAGEGRVAVVTGATGGIGQALVRRMRARGYTIIILSRHPRAATPGITTVICDLTDSESIKQAVTHIAAHTPQVDVLVHCAGIITPQAVGALDSATIATQIAVDLTAPIELTNALLPIMRRRGHIVFVNSMAAAFPL